MKVSLVCATVDRVAEPERLFQSLAEQTHRDFELAVVDQNSDDRLAPALARYREMFPIIHVRRAARGLSAARNEGLSRISGQVVAFPDDDCWYAPTTLERVVGFLNGDSQWDGVTGLTADETGRPLPVPWAKTAAPLARFNLWSRHTAESIFLRREVVDKVGGFNPELGLGAGTPWGSGEETDYVLRALEAGFRIRYSPDLVIYTRNPVTVYDEISRRRRAFSYALGQGRVLRTHRYPLWWLGYRSARSLAGAVLALASGNPAKARFFWSVFYGRIRGWRDAARG